MSPDSSAMVRCQKWVQDIVVGLDLCPWAAAPLANGQVRWRATSATDLAEIIAEVVFEAHVLADQDDVATALLVLESPEATPTFEDLLEVVDIADAVLEDRGLDALVQLVAFHPAFRFEGADPTDPANATNQSPVPMVHLLRVADVAALSVDGAALAERNARLLRSRAEAN